MGSLLLFWITTTCVVSARSLAVELTPASPEHTEDMDNWTNNDILIMNDDFTILEETPIPEKSIEPPVNAYPATADDKRLEVSTNVKDWSKYTPKMLKSRKSGPLQIIKELNEIVIVILSQPNSHHINLARDLKRDIQTQAAAINEDFQLVVHLSHIDFPHVGGWTIIPLIPKLAELHSFNTSFVFFVEDRTEVRLLKLLRILGSYAGKEEFIGFALHDNEPSIIHHFAFYNDPMSFKYPNVASGFAISTPLLRRLSKKMQANASKTDFNIDNAHELALFAWEDGNGVGLRHEPLFCIREEKECATYPEPFKPCEKAPAKESLYFAVKTCGKFHADRVRVVKQTWAKHAGLIKFFSDAEDETIPTITLGIPNTEHGHCEKTFSIIRHVAAEIYDMDEIEWVIIADDDTILSVSKLQSLLSCYDSSEEVALGERYGYGVHSSRGYNYITGGGGIVLSRPLLLLLADPENCDCPSPSAPDDMYLGFCLLQLDVSITHSPLFHQARPADYASGYLKSHSAVSFHKHWMVDPLTVYRTWFANADKNIHNQPHTEL